MAPCGLRALSWVQKGRDGTGIEGPCAATKAYMLGLQRAERHGGGKEEEKMATWQDQLYLYADSDSDGLEWLPDLADTIGCTA